VRAKRTAFTQIQCADLPELDLEALDKGEVVEFKKPGVLGFSALVPAHQRLEIKDVECLANLSAEQWVTVAKSDEAQINNLAELGFVVVDIDEEPYLTYRKHDEMFTAGGWTPEAACFHFAAEDRYEYDQAADLETAIKEAPEKFAQKVKDFGPPPPAFWEPERVGEWQPLPMATAEGQLYELLASRRSVRTYTDKALSKKQLATLLYEVWGCRGTSELAKDLPVLRKSAPAGGSMHPTEVYTLIRNVEGFEPGIYHYSSERHALGLIEAKTADEIAELAVECSHGQTWLKEASIIFIMTSRWTRHMWKYRDVSRAYTVMYMDAAHLSQSFYLVAGELGLGNCVTGALDAPTIESALGLDGINQGPLALIGCGYPDDRIVFEAEPFTPGAGEGALGVNPSR